jgi:hypothetical protein
MCKLLSLWHSKLCTAIQLAAVWSLSTSAPFHHVWQTAIQCCTTSQKSEDLTCVIVLGALASVGHGGAVHIHPLWARVMSMLIVIGEHIQCCPLLTNCHVQKRGDNCLRKSRGAVCGNTPYWTTQTSNPLWSCVLPSSLSSFVLTLTHAHVMLLGYKMLLLMHWSYVDITWVRYFKYVSFFPFCNFLCVLWSVFLFPILIPQKGFSRNMNFKSSGWQLCCCVRMTVYHSRSSISKSQQSSWQ